MKRVWKPLLAAVAAAVLAAPATAQLGGGMGGGGMGGMQGGGMGGGGMGGGGMGGGGMGGGMGGMGGGVFIDPQGTLRELEKKSASAKFKPLSPELREEVAARADLRQISLRQLDRDLRAALAKDPTGKALPAELVGLAGLQRIDYVIFDKSTQDVILCGPGEAFVIEGDGRAVGKTTGRPIITLPDLAVALRCVLAGPGHVDCSIDPRKEGLAKVHAFQMPEITGKRDQAEAIRKEYEKMLGLQTVTTGGVPHGSRFALAMIDADYRMKRMAMGLDKTAGLTTHMDGVVETRIKTGESPVGLARWWFTAAYEGIRSDADGTLFQFVGQGAQLQNESVLFDEEGNRRHTGRASEMGDKFSKSFTKLLPSLTEKFAVFADLKNLYDLTMVAGLVRQQEHAEWLAGSALLDAKLYAVPEAANAPKSAAPVVTFRTTRGMLSIAYGGVSIRPADVVKTEAIKPAADMRKIAVGKFDRSFWADGGK